MKSARVALGWPRLRRANGVDDVAAGVVGPAGRVGGPQQNPGDGVAVAAASATSLGDGSGPGTSSATGAVAPKTGTDAVGPKTSTSAPKTGMTGVGSKTGATGLGDGSGPGSSGATGAVAPKVGTDAVGPKTSTSAPKTGMTGVGSKTGAAGPRQRLTQALARGATLTRAAQEAGVSPQLAAVMVEQLRRSGSLLGATSLCASGLGACHSLEVDENTAIRCAGCPLSLKRTI